jgi:hypothetical protein
VYVPIPGDEIDEILGSFVNNSADPINLIKLFIRETPGTYLFGSKVISLSIEDGVIFGKFLLLFFGVFDCFSETWC